MRRNMRICVYLAVICPVSLLVGCQSGTAPATQGKTTNTAPTTATEAAPKTDNASTPAVAEKPAGSVSLATPTDTYKAAYAARRDKDIAGLKRLMSKDLTSFLTDIGKEEGKTLDDQIKEIFVKPQAATDESRGEKISGTRATVEYPDEQGKWKTMDFEKEGNDWKMTLPGKDGPPEK